jgi:uncharacterized paraquat-inducible protein A
MDMLTIECPNCHTRFDDDMPVLSDEAFFECPACDAEITITMTWKPPESPEEPQAA